MSEYIDNSTKRKRVDREQNAIEYIQGDELWKIAVLMKNENECSSSEIMKNNGFGP